MHLKTTGPSQPRIPRTVQSALIVLGPCAVWELLQTIPVFNPIFIPRPSQVLLHLLAVLRSGELSFHASYTMYRVGAGFSAAAVVGVPLGVAIGRWSIVEELVGPTINLLRPIAPIAWIPITILAFGLGWQGPVFIVFIGSFFPIVIASGAGVRDVEAVFVHCLQTLGASSRQLFREVILPGALPTVLMGGRIGLGVAWTCVVSAELFGARMGLGYMINSASMNFRILDIFVGMTAIGALGFASDLLYVRLVRWKLTWMPSLEELESS